ncbi:MAG: GTPase HflX [Bacteroidetes bacterium]|nr:GTPase HflX [Bacteroidota bacterium]MDA0972246.1 GTPase HflX [Bacteroidota bacterium]
MKETELKQETCVLVGVINSDQNEDQVKEYLDELAFLALTAGANTQKRFVQRLPKPHPGTFVGSGKLLEIKAYCNENDIDIVIFDDELSATQLRNIEEELGRKILDRNNLILDIFASRAQTAYAKTQVELAQYEYLLPRLTGMWTHLERQKGGIGMRGPGETQIESDRRVIQQKISKLKKDLEKIDKQMATQRGNRGALVRVALVGYTNVGKSTLMNLLSKSDVFAEDKLFATLDTTVRKITLHNVPCLLSDTVGFIRKLPHQLIESFKSTLDEVREADVLVHVLDISHPAFEDQYDVVKSTLAEIGGDNKPTIVVFNKMDACRDEQSDVIPEEHHMELLEELKQTWMAKLAGDTAIFISATEKLNIEELREILYQKVKEIHAVRFPYNTFLY